ncbi:hypothetical protein M3Y96_00217400 [Aphelenchoides besseyi]|nr:hypothetical protein M3Y96_00217400 [Aphelenchoides besseyi]
MFKLTLTPRPSKRVYLAFQRFMSAQEAVRALKPFYFAVHPDRFSREPKARKQNEKSLQIFNGFLNDLFPQPRGTQEPIRVNFKIMKNGEELEEISLELSGQDPIQIIKTALERCNLSTKHVPAVAKLSTYARSPRPSTSTNWPSADSVWDELRTRDAKRQNTKKSSTAYANGRVLLTNLLKNRNDALEKRKAHQRNRELLDDEIEYVQRKTGVKKILWSINWDQTYLRRCLVNVQQMLKSVDADTLDLIIHALNRHTLIFGRGSFICCDGSIQFGADDVSEAWIRTCRESTVRRFELQNLGRLIERVQDLLGGAEVKIDMHSNLLQTTHQLQSLIVRISSRPRADRDKLKELATESIIEVRNSYSELAIVSDGRIQVPCNVDGRLLLEFLADHRQLCTEMHRNMLRQKLKLEDSETRCRKALGLEALTYETTIPVDKLLKCFQRLENADEAIQNQLKGLEVHISTNSNIHVRPDGKISIPIDWV